MRCSRPLPAGDGPDRVCPECRAAGFGQESGPGHAPGPGFDRAASLGVYRGYLAHLIRQLKFDGRRELGFPLGNLLAWPVRARLGPLPADPRRWRPLVVPVPLHAARLRERGYNQAALVGAGLAAGLGLRLDEHILARATGGAPQSSLDRAARLSALAEAFAPARAGLRRRAGDRVAGRDVLLVDDVLTTGATLDACARVLKDLGARRVFGCTVAVGLPLRLWRGQANGSLPRSGFPQNYPQAKQLAGWLSTELSTLSTGLGGGLSTGAAGASWSG